MKKKLTVVSLVTLVHATRTEWKNATKALFILTTLLILPMLYGCGASLPTENAAGQFIRKDIGTAITLRDGGRISPGVKIAGVTQADIIQGEPYILVSIHKTNGQMGRNMAGVETYIMELDCEFEFTEDCYRRTGRGLVVNRGGDREHGGPNNVKKGERVKLSGHVDFTKTEEGWRPSSWQVQ